MELGPLYLAIIFVIGIFSVQNIYSESTVYTQDELSTPIKNTSLLIDYQIIGAKVIDAQAHDFKKSF